MLDSLQAFCRQVGEGLEDAGFARRQEVIRLMVERVVVEDGGRLRIELAIPLGGNGSDGSGERQPDGAGPSSLYALRPDGLGAQQTHHRTPGHLQVHVSQRARLSETLADSLRDDRGSGTACRLHTHLPLPVLTGECDVSLCVRSSAIPLRALPVVPLVQHRH